MNQNYQIDAVGYQDALLIAKGLGCGVTTVTTAKLPNGVYAQEVITSRGYPEFSITVPVQDGRVATIAIFEEAYRNLAEVAEVTAPTAIFQMEIGAVRWTVSETVDPDTNESVYLATAEGADGIVDPLPDFVANHLVTSSAPRM